MTAKHILLSAFECNPYMGSDAEVGWQWARQLSKRGYSVTVITRRTHQREIEQQVAATSDCLNVQFEYIDIEWLYRLTELVNPRNHIYYYFWQLVAFFHAKRLHKLKPFDLIHHVTWVSFRQPSFMGLVGAPMYFGPVAGGDEIPTGYTKSFSLKRRLMERFRSFVNAAVRFDPLMWLTYTRAEKVFFTSDAHVARVPGFVKKKAKIELAIGNDPELSTNEDKSFQRKGNRLLFVGRFLGLKGMDIGLQVFARVRQSCPDVTLTMIGDGMERDRWLSTAKKLKVDDAIEWRGWLPKDEVQRMYSEFDVFFFPSLRDSGGFVVLEALQHGMPVVCFRLGGPGVIVDHSCGRAIEASRDINKTISDFSEGILTFLQQDSIGSRQIASLCKQRAQLFTWNNLIARVYQEI